MTESPRDERNHSKASRRSAGLWLRSVRKEAVRAVRYRIANDSRLLGGSRHQSAGATGEGAVLAEGAGSCLRILRDQNIPEAAHAVPKCPAAGSAARVSQRQRCANTLRTARIAPSQPSSGPLLAATDLS